MSAGAEQFIRQAMGMKVFNAADWILTDPPAPDQVLEDVLDAGDKLAVIASSKLRKSFFVLQLALSLAAGRDFLGLGVPKARRTVYIQFEVREHHTHRRTRNLARAMGITPAALGDRLLIIPARGLGLAGDEGLERIRAAVADFQPEVMVFDPLYKLATGVENAAGDFKSLLAAFDRLAEETGAAVVFVHHDPKGSPGDKDIRDRGAGSGVLGRDYDACLTLTAHSAEPDATVVELLLRNYPPREPFTVVWDDSTGGYCFALAADILPDKRTSKTKPPAPKLETYLPAARTVLGRNGLPMGTFKAALAEHAGISRDRVRDFCRLFVDGDDPRITVDEARGKGKGTLKTVRWNEVQV